MKKLVVHLCAGLLLLTACSKKDESLPGEEGNHPADVVKEPVPFDQLPASSRVLNLSGTTTHVNVMGNKRADLPGFRDLAPKSNLLRGYVKDTYGRPLKNAEIGVRSSLIGGAYSIATAFSDDKGYYEVAVPAGVADIFRASYTIDYQEGRAPVSLFPSDSVLTHFQSTEGAVKNFVLLPYGRRHPDNVQENPWLSSNYLGGSIHISYMLRTQSLPLPGSIPEGEVIVVKLTPQELFNAGEKITFTVRKVVENSGFYINNIPLGRYKLEISLENGPDLNIKESINLHPEFGLNPKRASGTTSVSFIPGPGGVMAWWGNWETVPVNVEMP